MGYLERDDGTKMPVGDPLTTAQIAESDAYNRAAEEATVQPRTRIWVAIDFAADGPDATVVCRVLLDNNDSIVGWRIINPASETDKAEFNAVGADLARTFEEEGPMEPLPLETSD